MPFLLLQPYFMMSKNRRYVQILIGSRLFLTTMAIHLSLRVAPLQNGVNSRISYIHVPVAWMRILVFISTTIITTFFSCLQNIPFFFVHPEPA